MKKVYKYSISPTDEQIVALPKGAEPLHANVQEPFGAQLWALVDPDQLVHENWRVRLAGTGHPIDDEWTAADFVSTFYVEGGKFVFHVFAKRA